MPKKRSILAKIFTLPISKIYGMVIAVRNWMFDVRLLKDRKFDIPVLVVGNLAVGGTGKTPHTEFIVDRLRHSYHIGIISRGYKRSTKGFVMATRQSTAADIGDEPYQMYQKFNCEVPVAVCEDRVTGIEQLLSIDPQINLIVLDDAFQHRYVRPSVSVVLTEWSRPVFSDSMLPYGRLRESKKGLRRADVVVVTKCPEKALPIDMRIYEENLNLAAYQRAFFSHMQYCKLKPVFADAAPMIAPALEWLTNEDMLLTIAGIANPRPFVRFVKHFKPKVRVNIFPDHHAFTKKDMAMIAERFKSLTGKNNFIITTEKDAVRMRNNKYFPEELKPYTYYLPIKVAFIRDSDDAFIEEIRKLLRRQ